MNDKFGVEGKGGEKKVVNFKVLKCDSVVSEDSLKV